MVDLKVRGQAARTKVNDTPRFEGDGHYVVWLLPGTHRFSVERPGFEPVVESVRLEAGQAVALLLDAARHPKRGRLEVRVEPKDASILLDGRVLAVGQYAGSVKVGRHALEAKALGYHPVQRTVDIDRS